MCTRASYILLLLFFLCSCSWLHDDRVVARVGGSKLYLSQLEDHIPDGVSSDDSLNFARQYIRSWASDRVFEDVAERALGKDDTQIEEELKNYRLSLLKYRFEQKYLSERLDTLISYDIVEEYYKSHRAQFLLTHPIVKVRYLNVMSEAPYKEFMLRRLPSTDSVEVALLDSIARRDAIKYFDSSDKWMDARLLAREFGMDFRTLMTKEEKGMAVVTFEQSGEDRIAAFFDIMEGGVAPLDYCEPQVKDILMSARKREMIEELEQSLLDEALENKEFVIY